MNGMQGAMTTRARSIGNRLSRKRVLRVNARAKGGYARQNGLVFRIDAVSVNDYLDICFIAGSKTRTTNTN